MTKQTVDTVILGAGCWSAGQVLSGANVLVVDRGARVGEEYFAAFRQVAPLSGKCRSDWGTRLLAELVARGQENDFYALAPLLYAELKPHHRRFSLWTEVVGIQRAKDGWRLELSNISGSERITCRKLIDVTPECRSNPAFGRENIAGCRTNIAILTPEPEALLNWNTPDFSFSAGRTGDEVFAAYTHAATAGYPEVRQAVIDLWRNRPAGLKAARIAAFGQARDFDVKENFKELNENYCYFNGNQFENALAAIDTVEMKTC